VDRRIEEVDAGEREIRGRVGRLLDEVLHVPGIVDGGHAELTGVIDVREEDLGRGRSGTVLFAELRRAMSRGLEL